MHPQVAVSGKSLLLALALGAVPALCAVFFLADPLAPRDFALAGGALALGLALAWLLRGRLPELSDRCFLCLALLGAATPTLIAALRLDTTITNDERAYLYQAELFAAGRLAEPIPQPPEIFHRFQMYSDEERGIRYPKYSPGTALGLLPGTLAGWPMFSTLIAGLLDVLLLAAIARRLGLGTPALASLLLAFSPFFLLVQTSVQSEVFALPAVLAAYWALLRIREGGVSSGRAAAFGALAGVCTGFVLLGRPLTGALLALALGAGMLGSARRVPALLGAVLGGLPCFIGLLLYQQALTGDPFTIPYHLYALRYGPFNPEKQPIDIYGQGDAVQGLLDQAGRWSVAFAGMLGAVALGFWGLWRMRGRDGGAALLFALLGPFAYAFHWYQGHQAYLGPLYCYEALGFLLCGALLVLQSAPEPARRGFVLTALVAGPLVFALNFGEVQRLSDLRSAPQRAAREVPAGSVILYAPSQRSGQGDVTVKYYTPSPPTRRPNETVFVREPRSQPLDQALQQAGLSGRPVFRFVPDADLRSGRLEPVQPR